MIEINIKEINICETMHIFHQMAHIVVDEATEIDIETINKMLNLLDKAMDGHEINGKQACLFIFCELANHVQRFQAIQTKKHSSVQ
jgi:hypothetical protein